MSLETDFRALIVGDPVLLPLLTTAGVTRVYPSTYAQATASPAIRYRKVTGVTGLHMAGSDGLTESTMQVDVRVQDSTNAVRDALTIRDRLVELLHGFSGEQGGTEFRLIEMASDRGIAFDDTGATKYYSASVDFTVWSRSAA